MKKFRFGFFCLLVATSASADFVTERSAFSLVATNTTLENFDALVGAPSYPENYVGGFYAGTPGAITIDGIRYAGPEAYILPPDAPPAQSYSLNGTFALVLGRSSADIFFPRDVTAFGTDYGISGAATLTLVATVYLWDGTTTSTNLTVAGRSQFFGFVGTEIQRIHLDGAGGQYILLDNVAFGTTNPPAPVLSLRISQVEICWTSITNRFYQVQHRSDVTTNLWTDFAAPIQATETMSCVTDAVVRGQPQRYYRIHTVP